jgi:hypothetical protein
LAIADPRAPVLSRLQVAANLALGPVEPILRSSIYGSPVYAHRLELRGRLSAAQREALETREARHFATWSSYGSTYLLIACLMNLLLILDAWDIAIGRKA